MCKAFQLVTTLTPTNVNKILMQSIQIRKLQDNNSFCNASVTSSFSIHHIVY